MNLNMNRKITFFLLYVSTILGIPLEQKLVLASGNVTDQLALLAFKDEIVADPFAVLSSWNDSLHFCQWDGVTCSKRHQRVVMLSLEGKGLAGPLSPSIGNLSFLSVLNLGDNFFNGDIPKEVGNLFRLQVLNLSSNAFTGEIPRNLTRCKNLNTLNLESNSLGGNLLPDLTFNTNLQTLVLKSNKLTGTIPSSFGNLTSLEYLVLTMNYLEGSIPVELGQLRSLRELDVGGNMLSGTIPSSIYNLTSLTVLSLAVNQLYGTMPQNIGLSLPNIQSVVICVNHFSGTVPDSLSNATNLEQIDFSHNQLVGTIPESLGSLQAFQTLDVSFNYLGTDNSNDLVFLSALTNCTSLQNINLNNNEFKGVLPNSIGNLSILINTIKLGGNRFYGSIPPEIENLVNLNTLEIGRNALTGTIPSGIGKLQNLRYLMLSTNRITGMIPPCLGNMTVMIKLLLDNNDLGGNIPASLGNCQYLQVLNLSLNNFNGTLPKEIFSLSGLSISLNLAQNLFSGPLPVEVGNLKNLVELDISNNKLSGDIPETLGNCWTLERLFMDWNFFEGEIPPSMSALRSLYILDISHNNLTGEIPSYFESFPLLQYLDLSFNNLTGEVPTEGIFCNSSAISITGNSQLCGGLQAFRLPQCPIQVTYKHGKFSSLEAIIPLVIGAVCVISSLSFGVLYCIRSCGKSTVTNVSEDQDPSLSYMKLFRATNGFSQDNFIGRGRYGSVYKGISGDDQEEVAVKVLDLTIPGVVKSFKAEIEALKDIRHRNVIHIKTACSSMDSQGNNFRAIVYDLMPNGSLDSWLHPEEGQQHHERKLSFIERLNIAIDVAWALEYLHFYCHIPTIHCDLKPSNVLLDNEMTARVSDFGLARLLTETSISQATVSSSSGFIPGTIGYVAPEYGMGGKVSMHGDVYSYGILLLEMFTGKRPTDDMFKNGRSLHDVSKNEEPLKIVDPFLLQEHGGFEDESEDNLMRRGGEINVNDNKWVECLIMVIKIGLTCSSESPAERMDLRDVAKELQAIRTSFLQPP